MRKLNQLLSAEVSAAALGEMHHQSVKIRSTADEFLFAVKVDRQICSATKNIMINILE